jgi:hypothetical protein
VSALPAPQLIAVAHVEVALGEIADVGELPYGRRRVIPITGGRVEGSRLAGEVLPGGADWQLVWEDGTAQIDTRYLMRTDDGAHVVIATRGYRFGPPEVLARLAAGEDVPATDYTFRVTVDLETADRALAWINRTVFVGIAQRRATAVAYDLYALA